MITGQPVPMPDNLFDFFFLVDAMIKSITEMNSILKIKVTLKKFALQKKETKQDQ